MSRTKTKAAREATALLGYLPERGTEVQPQHGALVAEAGHHPAPDVGAKEVEEAETGDLADLERLEGKVAEGERKRREAVEALRVIRQRDLYKLGGYDTFDDYVECRWNRTRQWATQEINWLRACECLESAGKHAYQFSVRAVQPAARLLADDPEGFCEVYLAAAEGGLPVTEVAVKTALADRDRFLQLSGEWDRHLEAGKVPDAERIPLTKGEAALVDFDWHRRSYGVDLVDRAKQQAVDSGRTWQECLPEVCREAGKFPMPIHLLAAARGDDLENVVRPLLALTRQWEEQKQAASELACLDEKRKELRRKAGIKPKPKNGKDKPGVGEGESVGVAGDKPEDEGENDEGPIPEDHEEEEKLQGGGLDLRGLGVLQIGPGDDARVEAEAFRSVSAVDRERKLLVCGRWDRRAKEASSRGIAVLVLPELQQGGRP